uniref:Ig-like domain-containing protein n=1 Tax=Myripristis murdjan TaxID=586833 RepID=A0A667WB27_9TELE
MVSLSCPFLYPTASNLNSFLNILHHSDLCDAIKFAPKETPDSVSIRALNHTGPMMVEEDYQLQCDIISIAPVQILTVMWYRGNETIKMTGCPQDDKTGCVIRAPVNVTSTISIRLDRSHSRVEFRCEAQLDLGLEGRQPPETKSSVPLDVTVHYKPIINATKLPTRIPVFRGYPEDLVCEAEGHPTPKIQWFYSSENVIRVSEGKLTVSEAGLYTCNATNEVDSSILVVEVILKEMPDSVTISPSSHLGPMVEGKKYSLRCDIDKVAPVKNLSVIWQKRNETIHSQSYNSEVNTPVQESSVLIISPSRDDNGAQIHCAAQLNLGPMGPNPAVMASNPHEMIRITCLVCLFSLIFSLFFHTSVPPTFTGKNILNCTATGNPKPVYSWQSPHPLQVDTKNKAVLTPPMLLPGTYNCTATNAIANRTKMFIVSEVQGKTLTSFHFSSCSALFPHSVCYSITPPHCCSPPGSHLGTTAGILLAMVFLVISSLCCVVYHKNRKPSVAREAGQIS